VKYIFIAFGGALGALCRYLSSNFINKILNIYFPAGTLTVNIAGSLLIGFLFSVFETRGVPAEFRLFLMTGFLGAYTTFSTYSLETVHYLLDGNIKLAVINIFVSNIACILFVFAGIKFGKLELFKNFSF
jgi:CrcB protein